jgi:hypothetical protein
MGQIIVFDPSPANMLSVYGAMTSGLRFKRGISSENLERPVAFSNTIVVGETHVRRELVAGIQQTLPLFHLAELDQQSHNSCQSK